MANKKVKQKFNKEQRAWCKGYETSTTFEALMDDFLEGNETFEEGANKSIRWFESWTVDALRGIPDIPGKE